MCCASPPSSMPSRRCSTANRRRRWRRGRPHRGERAPGRALGRDRGAHTLVPRPARAILIAGRPGAAVRHQPRGPAMPSLVRHLALLLACPLLGTPVLAETPVDVALVLAVDASGSIDPAEFQLQKEGIAGAVTHEVVLQAVTSGPNRRIAVAYVEWGSPGQAETVVNWMFVEDKASAERFARAVLAA